MHISFTDGICQKCAARVRADHLRARFDRGASADRREPAWLPGLAVVALAIVIGLVLVARPTHELPVPPPVVALLPEPAPEPAAAPEAEPAVPRLVHVARRPRPVVRPARAAATLPLRVELARLTWPVSAAIMRVAVTPPRPPQRVIPAPRDAAQSP